MADRIVEQASVVRLLRPFPESERHSDTRQTGPLAIANAAREQV